MTWAPVYAAKSSLLNGSERPEIETGRLSSVISTGNAAAPPIVVARTAAVRRLLSWSSWFMPGSSTLMGTPYVTLAVRALSCVGSGNTAVSSSERGPANNWPSCQDARGWPLKGL
jgi:hypothetical protein